MFYKLIKIQFLPIWFLAVSAIFLSNCSKGGGEDVEYSFFVAGHLYGDPKLTKSGIHPPFKEKIPFINKHPKIKFGVLTGDVVKASTEKHWSVALSDLSQLNMPFHIAPGNHELIRHPGAYEKRFGKTYYSFTQNDDLFIILNPLLDGWNISGAQLQFLKKAIQKKETGHIFVFAHQLLWWSPDNEYKKYKPNWIGYRADSINFWNEIIPLFEAKGLPTYFFAGDIGAYPKGMSYFYHQRGKIHFIASGMGGGNTDNFLIVSVHKNRKVTFELIALNGNDIHKLGKLEDFPFE